MGEHRVDLGRGPGQRAVRRLARRARLVRGGHRRADPRLPGPRGERTMLPGSRPPSGSPSVTRWTPATRSKTSCGSASGTTVRAAARPGGGSSGPTPCTRGSTATWPAGASPPGRRSRCSWATGPSPRPGAERAPRSTPPGPGRARRASWSSTPRTTGACGTRGRETPAPCRSPATSGGHRSLRHRWGHLRDRPPHQRHGAGRPARARPGGLGDGPRVHLIASLFDRWVNDQGTVVNRRITQFAINPELRNGTDTVTTRTAPSRPVRPRGEGAPLERSALAPGRFNPRVTALQRVSGRLAGT
jgi:hypothetical protein